MFNKYEVISMCIASSSGQAVVILGNTSTLVLLLHLIYLSYLSNVYRAYSFLTNLDFCIENARALSIGKYGNCLV
jgi:hypothetical protein